MVADNSNKAKQDTRACFRCGRRGHIAKTCRISGQDIRLEPKRQKEGHPKQGANYSSNCNGRGKGKRPNLTETTRRCEDGGDAWRNVDRNSQVISIIPGRGMKSIVVILRGKTSRSIIGAETLGMEKPTTANGVGITSIQTILEGNLIKGGTLGIEKLTTASKAGVASIQTTTRVLGSLGC